MKKLVLGIAVCCGISGVLYEYASGMNSVNAIVSDMFKTQEYKEKLDALVELMVARNDGARNTRYAIDAFGMISEKERQNEEFDKVGCMLWTLSYHWEAGYRLVHDKKYYVDGALNGTFGPYDF